MHEKKIVFCANCGSTNIKPVYFMENIDNRVQCIDCNTIEFPIEGGEDFHKEFVSKLKKGGRKAGAGELGV